ncbi:MAG TPA: 3'-5' exonuclease [Candidatus Paceibacterota bacterium]|nr:3'-5' exonuclease [Candidatus Paceibacterota bacterium]
MLNQTFAFIDVETTGLSTETHEIIELGAVLARVTDGALEVVDQVDLKVKPEHIETADQQALRVNNYDEGAWLFAYTLEEAIKTFAKKTNGAIMIAHNLAFDYGFISKAFEKTGIANDMHYHKLDTISIAFAKLAGQGDVNKFSLNALCQYYGIENKRAHSAFSDAYATYEVFKKLMGLK